MEQQSNYSTKSQNSQPNQLVSPCENKLSLQSKRESFTPKISEPFKENDACGMNLESTVKAHLLSPSQDTDEAYALSQGSESASVVSPSLVIYGQSRTKSTWTRRQKRLYKNLSSWISVKKGEGAQILRVDLTSIRENNYNLTGKLQKLRRLIEKTFHYRIQYFKVETSEGNGVLHMIWAIKHPAPVYISQQWLSDAWKQISGAYIVYICKLATRRQNKNGRQYKFRTIERHIRDIASYMATQYIADQSAIVRVSWSWWRGDIHLRQAFKDFLRLAHRGRYVPGEGLQYLGLPRWKLYHGWTELLLHRLWSAEDRTFRLKPEGVICEYH